MRLGAKEPVATELPPYVLRGPPNQVGPCRGRRQGIRTAPHRVKPRPRQSPPEGIRQQPSQQLPQGPEFLLREAVQETLPELRRIGDPRVLQEPPSRLGDHR